MKKFLEEYKKLDEDIRTNPSFKRKRYEAFSFALFVVILTPLFLIIFKIFQIKLEIENYGFSVVAGLLALVLAKIISSYRANKKYGKD